MIFKRCLGSMKHLITVFFRPYNWSSTNRLSESAYSDLQKGINHVNPILIPSKKSLKIIKVLSALKLIKINGIKTIKLSERTSNKIGFNINTVYYANFRTTQRGRELVDKLCHYANQYQDCFEVWWPILMSTVLFFIFIILFEIICLLTESITVMAVGITIVIALLCIFSIIGWGNLREYKRRTALPTAKQLEKFLNINNRNKYVKYIVDSDRN